MPRHTEVSVGIVTFLLNLTLTFLTFDLSNPLLVFGPLLSHLQNQGDPPAVAYDLLGIRKREESAIKLLNLLAINYKML